jgi:tetratricopeptide (TPR) repeat protein
MRSRRLSPATVLTAVTITVVAAPMSSVYGSSVELLDLGRIDARTGALLVAGEGGGQIDGAAVWRLRPAEPDSSMTVETVVEIGGTSLLADSPPGTVPIVLAAYVFDGARTLVAHLSKGVLLDDPFRQQVRDTGLRWIDQLELDPGDYSIRLVVRNHRTDRVFLARLDVTVPDVSNDTVEILPPLVDAPSSGWVDARPPEVSGADLSAPPARPVIAGGEPIELQIAATGGVEPSELRARLVDVAGRTVAEPRLEATGASRPGSPYRGYRLEEVDVPQGRYRLVVRRPAGIDGREPVALLEVLVASAANNGTWPTVQLTGGPRSTAVETEAVRTSKLREVYRTALAHAARGDGFAARRTLAPVEEGFAASSSARDLVRLARVERDEAADAAADDPDALRPIVWMHRELYRYYRVRGASILASHSWRLVADLATLLAARGSDDARAFAADVIAEQATELAQAPAMRAATELYRRALRIEPGHADILMAFGACLERQGDAEEAVDVFRKVVELEPDRAEARLRLAVNLDRIGRARESRGIFTSLVTEPGPRWVRTVAVQELARMMIEDDAPSEAVRTLASARDILGPNPRLTIQLARAYDAAGAVRESAATLENLEVPARAGVSPRLQYAEWPQLGPRLDHQELADRARQGRRALAAEIGVSIGEGS